LNLPTIKRILAPWAAILLKKVAFFSFYLIKSREKSNKILCPVEKILARLQYMVGWGFEKYVQDREIACLMQGCGSPF
jgi:hypothetical protein